MIEIKTLPLLQDAKFIVIDEGVEVLRATDLVVGWLQLWQSNMTNHQTDLLLFSDPKFYFEHWTKRFETLKIHDYYTQDINNIEKTRDIDLEGIMESFSSSCKSTVIVNCLNGLILSVGLARAIRFIEKFGRKVSQLICIYRRDFGLNKVPMIQTLGSTYVRLDKSCTTSLGNDIAFEISVIHRKSGGGISKNHVMITQDISTYEIKSEKTPIIHSQKFLQSTVSEFTLKPQATFRMEMSAREIDQRNKTPLPYTNKNNNTNSTNESKILYVPDDVDDIDEEDPDDDLPF